MDACCLCTATIVKIQAVHKHTAPSLRSTLLHHSQAHCIITHKPAQLSALAKLCRNAGNFAPGADLDTGRYSVLGSLPHISSVHGAMHDYHTQSEVGITLMHLCSHLIEQGLASVSLCVLCQSPIHNVQHAGKACLSCMHAHNQLVLAPAFELVLAQLSTKV
jgi:hypothetical protein